MHLAGGGVLAARAVVVAASQRLPIIPAALRGHHAGVEAGTTPPSLLRTWRSVDPGADLAPGRRILVVGGGMAGASLALQAGAAGAAVTLISRRWVLGRNN